MSPSATDPTSPSTPSGAPSLGHTVLGQVGVGSGALAVVDFGHLRHWSRRGAAPGPAPSVISCGPVAAITVGGVPKGNHTLYGVRAGESEAWR